MPGTYVDRWKAVSQYLDRALELPASEREAWLVELDRTAPEAAVEVRKLLDVQAHGDFAHFLAESPAVVALEPSLGDLAGRRVGPYLLTRELGRGGMGSVWLASRSDGHYDAQVAVKLLSSSWLGLEGPRRFHREGSILARLDHPNVARLLDAGVTESGQHYLVLEYVQGTRIDEYCDANRLGVEARLRLFLDVLGAVAYAHRQLIIHRDIKPGNIFVTADGTVKLLDFGIARLVTHDGPGGTLTRADSSVLTPEFAAPEQLLGQPVTTATDVYALGLTLYLLLTGRHPFAAPSNTPAATALRALDREPPRASLLAAAREGIAPESLAEIAARRGTTPEALSRELRGDLDNILAKALRKAPNERYGSVASFADDVRRYLQHEPVSAGPDTVRYRVGKFVRRYRGAVAAGALTAVILVAATITTFLQMVEARRQAEEARFQARRAESANEFLNVLLLSDGGPDKPALTGIERLELGVQMVEQQYRGDPAFAGRMLIQFGRQFRGLTNTRRAVELMSRAYELGKQAGDTELMALAQCTAAYAEVLAQRTTLAPGRIREAKELIAGMVMPPVGLRVDCLQAEAQLAGRTGDTRTAERLLNQARRELEEAGETHRAAYTSVLNNLGGIYNETFRLREALAMAQLVGATHERYGRGGTSARMIALHNETVVIAAMGEARAALNAHGILQQQVRALEPEGNEPLNYRVNRAIVLVRLDRPEEALEALDGVAERARNVGNTLWQFHALRTASMAHASLGHAEEAQAALAQAMALLDDNTASRPRTRIPLELVRAQLQMDRGALDEAKRTIDAALALAHYPDKKEDTVVFSALALAARLALRSERYAEAETYARDALTIVEPVARGRYTSADVGEALLLVASARIAQGHPQGTKPLLERAVRSLRNGLGNEHRLTREAQRLLASAV